MKTVTREVYVTNDNKEFTDRAAAMAYQAKLENEVLIDDFLASLEDKTEQAKSRMRNDIAKFLGFKAQCDADMQELEDAEDVLDAAEAARTSEPQLAEAV